MSGPGYAPPPQGAPHFEAPGWTGHPTPSAPPALPGGQAFPGYPRAGQAPVPPPPLPGPVSAGPVGPPQRPAVIALGCTLAVLGSLQWICGLSLLWVTATVGTGAFAEVNDNGAVFHILNRFDARMLDGLAVPLYLFPLASLVTGFLVLSRRPWTRLAHSAVGLVVLAWAAWWLRDDLLWWFSAAWYIAVACLVLWTPAATAWYRWRADGRDGHPIG
ncbi:hypothetical protein SAMN04488543_4008 [Friedmanniella luteola]|uniref:Uncharacterized protein n=1 Tax=Friedmanniella luteola TaxID=546871 RepID=A0A1H1ZU90_9ACTN|nr:hypothetical protein [Friedmanniella luteola]SDT37230.1 hypothetical protein SAMN04488543_4008 [Friedmanniella luteola]